MPAVVAEVSSFGIRELTGADPKDVVLVDRGLPYRPYNLKTAQRVELTWYPGNPQATATVLGAKEEPSTINGMWKDKFIQSAVPADLVNAIGFPQGNQLSPIMLNGRPPDDVREAAAFVDDIVRGGQLVEVTWDDATRHGFLVSFDKSWHTVHDLEWSMAFEWISRGEPVIPSVLVAESSLSDSSGQYSRLNAVLQAISQALQFAADLDFTAQRDEILGQINEHVIEVQNAVANLVRLAVQPVDAIRRVISLSTLIIGDSDALIDLMTGEVDGGFGIQPIGELSFQDRLTVSSYNRSVIKQARLLRREAVARRARLTREIERELLGTYTARQGDDLRTVAFRFYDNPNEWRRLLIFNQLVDPVLTAGQLVLVPKTNQTDRR